ncbi:hypothetical protein C0992_005223 [Termitomyces sp. T32_za158]|nr:hypothetical protein C0992_005223 [Termitomyces sp. T32_za158]
MSSIARYLSSALSRLSFFGPVDFHDALVSPRTPQSPESPPVSPDGEAPPLVRGLILSTSPYLKGTAADPKVSFTPAAAAAADSADTSSGSFDISLSSDTSTSSSCSEDSLITPLRSLDKNDLFSPRHDIPSSNSSFPNTPSPSHLVGLGISGISRRDGKPGDFDGLGLVGVRRSFSSRNPFLISADDDDDDGYVSPTPIRVHRRENDKRDEQELDDELSETFMRELVFTWETDPQHTRILSTIPECDDEDELEFQQVPMKMKVSARPSSSPEPTSSASPSPSRCHSAPIPPYTSSTPSPLTLNTAPRPQATQALMPTHQAAESPLHVSRVSSRNSHSSHTRSRSSSPPTSVPMRGRTNTRSKNPSGLRSKRDDGESAAPGKRKPSVKGAWRA